MTTKAISLINFVFDIVNKLRGPCCTFGDILGDGETWDGHPDKTFHYMLANSK
jgi:hypothetical protein